MIAMGPVNKETPRSGPELLDSTLEKRVVGPINIPAEATRVVEVEHLDLSSRLLLAHSSESKNLQP